MQEFWRLFIEKAPISHFISHLPPIYHHAVPQKTKSFQHISGSMAEKERKNKKNNLFHKVLLRILIVISRMEYAGDTF